MKKSLYRVYSEASAFLPDSLAVSVHFWMKVGYWPNLKSPKTFNEKIQYRKLYSDPRVYASFADKLKVKEYVGATIGQQFVIPTIWSGRLLPPPGERHWNLPVVIKANHGSGHNYFARTAADLVDPKLDQLCSRWNSRRSLPHLREKFYDLIDRRILVEPMIGESVTDYKVYVFSGKAHFIHVDVDRFTKHKRSFFDRDWSRLQLGLQYGEAEVDIPEPAHLDEILRAAELLASSFEFARVDFYDLEDGPRFGEMTFTPGGGYERFRPADADHQFGALWRFST